MQLANFSSQSQITLPPTLKPTIAEVFVANRSQLQRVAQKIVHTADLADEVLQDAYLKLMEGGCALTIHKPLGYCCQIVRNVAFDYHRKQSVEVSCRTYCDDLEIVGPQVCETPERVAVSRQALQAIERVLKALPLRTRHAFELSRLGGLTQREIGVQLGCSATLVNFMIKDVDQVLEGCRYLVSGD